MKRITVSLPETLADAVDREARRRGVPVSEIVRRALTTRLGWQPSDRPQPAFACLGRSGHTDTARRIDEILAKEWGPALPEHKDR